MRRTVYAVTGALAAAVSGMNVGCSGNERPIDENVGASTDELVARPAARLVLSDAVVRRLHERAAAGDPTWIALKKRCDDYATGTANPPNGDAYPDYPNVGQGYQGEDYVPVIRALGLCYRTSTDAAAQARYGAAGSRVLDAMSTPVDSGGQAPSTDSGYGIRNYVVGMAFGFDWLYPALSASTKSRAVATMNAWIGWYDESGFIHDDPIGNYFAGYFLAKTAAALATEGENPNAAGYWDDVVDRMWGKLVKPAFTTMMAGGGWPEGWGYGRKAVLGMVEALWIAKTAKGLDWNTEVPLAHDEAAYVERFSWPSLLHMDDQGTIRSGITPRPSPELLEGLATELEQLGDSSAGAVRGFAADVIAADGDDSAAWSAFLYGDGAASTASYKSEPLSHLAAGPGHVGVRSSWDPGAVWGALSGGAYIDAPDSGEQLFDAGSLSVVVGDRPVLVNPTGWLPQNGGTAGEDFVYDDSWGNKERRLYNTFFVDDASNPYNPGQNSASPADSGARVERFEDRGLFVRARATHLEDQYGASGARPVSRFTRDLVYVRPGSFVIFDRTTVARAGADQWLSFHTPVAPSSVATSDATQRRFDVVVGGVEMGSIRTLLPRSAKTTSTSLPASASRLEVHAPAPAASEQWLTVVTAGAAAGEQVRLSPADGNVVSGDVIGVAIGGSPGNVVLFAADQAATGALTGVEYAVPAASADHVLVDVAPSSSGYVVTAQPANGKLTIRVAQGGSFKVSNAGTLSFAVSAAGAVSAGASTAPSAAPPPSTSTPEPPPSASAPEPPPMTSPDPVPSPPSQPDPPSPGDASQTIVFTQGVDGYADTRDASISDLHYSSSDNPNGTTYRTNDVLYAYELDYTTHSLLRFDVSKIPATATVLAATLALTFESWTGPQTVLGAFLVTPWDYDGVGWTDTGAGASWSAPGIGLADLRGPGFRFSEITASGYQRLSVPLPAADVQLWVRCARDNQGLVLGNRDSGNVLRILSSETSDPAQRPTLSITYQ